jgi:hypothetical protein
MSLIYIFGSCSFDPESHSWDSRIERQIGGHRSGLVKSKLDGRLLFGWAAPGSAGMFVALVLDLLPARRKSMTLFRM